MKMIPIHIVNVLLLLLFCCTSKNPIKSAQNEEFSDLGIPLQVGDSVVSSAIISTLKNACDSNNVYKIDSMLLYWNSQQPDEQYVDATDSLLLKAYSIFRTTIYACKESQKVISSNQLDSLNLGHLYPQGRWKILSPYISIEIVDTLTTFNNFYNSVLGDRALCIYPSLEIDSIIYWKPSISAAFYKFYSDLYTNNIPYNVSKYMSSLSILLYRVGNTYNGPSPVPAITGFVNLPSVRKITFSRSEPDVAYALFDCDGCGICIKYRLFESKWKLEFFKYTWMS